MLDLLRRAVDEFGQTVVMVTHDPDAAAVADRLIELADGRIVRDEAVVRRAGAAMTQVRPSAGSSRASCARP